MAKFGSLSAPVTNQQAAKRIQDTQALRARQMVAGQPTASTQPAAQAGAQLTQAAGQANLQQQQQTAGMAQQRVSQQLASQQQAAQKRLFGAQKQQTQEERLLDESLFNLNQNAATQEQDMRNRFANGQAQTEFLQEQELADWALANAKNEDEFKDRIQEIEQAHAKKTAMINQAYKVIMQDLRQQADQASQEDAQKLKKELIQIETAWKEEMTKRQNAAANRQAMFSAGGAIIGAAGGAALSMIPGMQAFAPALIVGGAKMGEAAGSGLATTDI